MTTELDRELQQAPYESPRTLDFPMQPRKSRRVLRIVVWVAVVVLVIAGGMLAYMRRARAPQLHYDTANADRGTIAAKVTATGNLSALLTVQVGSQVSGRVQQLFADYNSSVSKGQTIAKLDPVLFEAAVEQARANLLSAEASLKKDQAQAVNTKQIYDRTKSLMAAKIVAQSDLDAASANYEAAEALIEADQSNLEALRASLHQVQVNMDYTTIIAPIDGTVISRNVDVGQTVAASFQAPTLFVIAQDLRRMQVDTNVGEADVGSLSAGMKATFTVDAFPTKEFTGKLRQIRNAAQTLQNVVTYDAVIDVDNPDLLLRPGMTANVTFIASQRDNVVRLRNAALRFEPDPAVLARVGLKGLGDNSTLRDPKAKIVWLLRDDKPSPVTVSTGVSDGTWTELVKGDVKPGDTLITDMTVNAKRGLF